MKLAIISDTHLYTPDQYLYTVYESYLADADVLVHCGDMVGREVHDFFSAHPGFYAVRGNCDYYDGSEVVPEMCELELAGYRLGAAHGWGRRSAVGESVCQAFGPEFDLILYGHTHIRDFSRSESGVWKLNPGSLTSPRDGGPASLAIVDLGEKIAVRFVEFDSR